MNSKLSRRDDQRLSDIAAAAEAIAEHVSLLDSDEIPESVLIDAIKYNLVSIGEAANHVSEALKKQHSDIEWPAIVGAERPHSRVLQNQPGLDCSDRSRQCPRALETGARYFRVNYHEGSNRCPRW